MVSQLAGHNSQHTRQTLFVIYLFEPNILDGFFFCRSMRSLQFALFTVSSFTKQRHCTLDEDSRVLLLSLQDQFMRSSFLLLLQQNRLWGSVHSVFFSSSSSISSIFIWKMPHFFFSCLCLMGCRTSQIRLMHFPSFTNSKNVRFFSSNILNHIIRVSFGNYSSWIGRKEHWTSIFFCFWFACGNCVNNINSLIELRFEAKRKTSQEIHLRKFKIMSSCTAHNRAHRRIIIPHELHLDKQHRKSQLPPQCVLLLLFLAVN